jgi:CBS domain-containing protein
LREVAGKMRDEQVHRVLVLNPQRRLLGIISSFDFVRIFAEAT